MMAPLQRWRWTIRGQVQGVGFRPFVFRVAHQAGVTGFIFNDPAGVLLEVQGATAALEIFAWGFKEQMPPLARVDHLAQEIIAPIAGEQAFAIVGSQAAGAVETSVTIDAAVCGDCLREMRDPADRRFGHGLINCTNCGPRLSIIRAVPYDRANTTMAGFAMCPDCRAEYENPADRRFHAQPVCCPQCGPQIQLVKVVHDPAIENPLRPLTIAGDSFQHVAELLMAGKIVAIKGLGGFHLAVRADDTAAVARLRRLKQRDSKPFAIMCRDRAMADQLVTLSDLARRELAAPRAPIMLAPRRATALVAPGVAPGNHRLGVMLPYTPMQHLLWDRLGDLCAGSPPPLVLTSGNISDEPLVIDNDDAVRRLGGLCDAILWHDRPIERCVDDTVLLDRGPGQSPLALRRSRGYVPEPLAIPPHLALRGGDVARCGNRALPERQESPDGKGTTNQHSNAARSLPDGRGSEMPQNIATPQGSKSARTGICLGGELKNTIAIVTAHEIILSQHLGDLSNALAYQYFQKAIDDLIRLYDLRIDFVAHDLHPQYMSTTAAAALARRHNARLLGVQHHHAHAAAVLAENQITAPALAIVCDGTRYGTDGTIWGGELLRIHGAHYQRLGRLRPIRLPGGDAAARDTRRCGLSLLHLAYGADFAALPATARLVPDPTERQIFATMITRGVNSPWTSSTGRLFDGIAALLGLCLHNDHEAQAAMELESAAAVAGANSRAAMEGGTTKPAAPAQPLFEIIHNPTANLWEINLAPLVRHIVDSAPKNLPVNDGALLFHRQLAAAFIALANRAADGQTSLIGCSGGSLCNQIFAMELEKQARESGFSTFFHKAYPAMDAGLALGQAIISLEMLTEPVDGRAPIE